MTNAVTLSAEALNLSGAHLVETGWLAGRLDDPAIRVIDMRGRVETSTQTDGCQVARYSGARDDYLAGHIPGALYLDWTSDIVDRQDPVAAQVAGPEQIARVFGAAGIDDRTLVIAYDE